jgi:hypothetical protein
LDPSALYELAAPKTPIEVREEVEKMIEAGEVVTKATFQEVRAKLSGLEKAKTLVEQEIEEKAAKVADLEENINTADGFTIEIPWSGIKHALSGDLSRPTLAAALRLDELIASAQPG